MGAARFLWGVTKVDIVEFTSFDAANLPPGKKGRMFMDSNGEFRLCQDGTTFVMITVEN